MTRAAQLAKAAAGGSMVLQIVGGSNQHAGNGPITTSASFVSSNIALSITPTAASSKVLIEVCMPCQLVPAGSSNYGAYTVYRNGSNLLTGSTPSTMAYLQTSSNSGNAATTIPFVWLDSPNTTSVVTYTIYFLTTGSSFQLSPIVQNMGSTGYTFTLKEIAG